MGCSGFLFLISDVWKFLSDFGFRISSFLLLASITHAASIETFDGTKITGALALDGGRFVITPDGGAAVKVNPADVWRAQFTEVLPVENFTPGVILRNGTRLVGAFTPLTEPVVNFDRYQIAVPAGEIAWVVYQPFSPTVAASAPIGKVGALLAGGDFFEGTIKAADDKSAKLLHPIFGPRTLVGGNKDLLALILRDARRSAALFEVRTKDGALFGVDALGLDQTGVTLRHPLYDNVKIETKDLVEIRAGPARYQPLTALRGARVEPLPGRKIEECFAVDKTIAGDALDNLGAAHGKGFESVLGVATTWEVPAGFTMLNVLVAVPAGVPPAQRLIFAVYADGRPIARSSPLSPGDKPVSLRANFGVARSLALRVEAGSPANATGSGLWLDPVLTHR